MNRQQRDIWINIVALSVLVMMSFIMLFLQGCCTIRQARHDSINAMKEGYIEGYIDGHRDLQNRIIEEDEKDKLEEL